MSVLSGRSLDRIHTQSRRHPSTVGSHAGIGIHPHMILVAPARGHYRPKEPRTGVPRRGHCRPKLSNEGTDGLEPSVVDHFSSVIRAESRVFPPTSEEDPRQETAGSDSRRAPEACCSH